MEKARCTSCRDTWQHRSDRETLRFLGHRLSTGYRAQARGIALAVACDTHLLNNLRVFTYLNQELGVDLDAKLAWICTWLENGLAAVEQLVLNVGHSESYCLGETPGIADLCVIPQLYNARRIDYDPSLCPTLVEIDSLLADHPAFQAAHPANQPDSEA